jgi:hypothetical protein
MNRMLLLLSTTVLCVSAFAVDSFATQVIQKSPKELAQLSQLVVDGKVQNVRSYWNDDHSKIFTEAVISVEATHKGVAAQSVRVVQLGGVVDNVRMTAHGALQWKQGEDVLLFLEPATPGAYQVTGFSQGKYLIEHDPQTGAAYVKQALPPDAGTKSSPAASTTARERVTLEQFLDSVLPNE